MARLVLAWLLALAAALLAAVTLLPLAATDAWWVRMWEFPRLYILATALILAIPSIIVLRSPWRGWITLTLLGVIAWQGTWTWRYAPFAPTTAAMAEGQGITAVSLNLLQSNGNHDAVRSFLSETDPDVLLLLEVDATWAKALAPIVDGYPHSAKRVADDYYGMILATRLDVDLLELRHLADDVTPIAVADLRAPGGRFVFTGLHPRPPVPHTTRAERDKQIAETAALARRLPGPAVAMGDFNDVPWSRANRTLRRSADLRDPRQGRGVKASFDMTSWWNRVPIDGAFVTDGIVVHDFSLGPDVGSDHLPVVLRFSIGG